MKKTFAFLAIMAFAIVGVIATPDEGSAVPSFARQTGNPCWACHFQHIPKLNAMGRAFKYGGFTDTTTDQIEDDYLALNGVTLPLSFVSKLRYVKTSKDKDDAVDAGTDRGQLDIPDEANLYFGGKIADNVGFAIEYPGPEGWANGKVVFAFPVANGSLGLSIMGGADGPGFAMETFNTGLQAGHRGWESKNETSIFIRLGTLVDSTAVVAYYGDDMFFIAAGIWGPARNPDTNFDLSQYVRATVVIPVGENELMIGAVGQFGSTTCVECAGGTEEATFNTDFVGVDAQFQGEVGGMTIEAIAEYASAGDSATATLPANEIDLYGESNGFSASLEVGLTPQIGLKLAGMSITVTDATGKDIDGSSVSAGAYYNFAQNVNVAVGYTSFSGDLNDANNLNQSDKLVLTLLFAI